MYTVCSVYGLSFPGFVMPAVCHACGLSCLGFVCPGYFCAQKIFFISDRWENDAEDFPIHPDPAPDLNKLLTNFL
jgi:hypothetical protein